MGYNNYFFAVAFAKEMQKRLEDKGICVELSVADGFRRVRTALYCLGDDEQARIERMSAKLVEEVLLIEETFFSSARHICIDSLTVKDADENRDVIFRNADTGKEIGFKWVVNANVRHVRLLAGGNAYSVPHIIDIGKAWFGIAASDNYYRQMQPVIEHMRAMHNMPISDVYKDKVVELYAPVLETVKQEIVDICTKHPDAPERLMKHFFCKNDFYEITPIANSESIKISAYNLQGNLGAEGNLKISRIAYPTELIEVRQKELSSGALSRTTLNLVFDNGWYMELRLHTTGTKISGGVLMFDVRVTGVPYGIWQTQIF